MLALAMRRWPCGGWAINSPFHFFLFIFKKPIDRLTFMCYNKDGGKGAFLYGAIVIYVYIVCYAVCCVLCVLCVCCVCAVCYAVLSVCCAICMLCVLSVCCVCCAVYTTVLVHYMRCVPGAQKNLLTKPVKCAILYSRWKTTTEKKGRLNQ